MPVVCALSLSAACGGGGEAPASSADEAPLTSGQTAFARKLGGAGSEVSAGIATCPDGSIVAASFIGGGPTSSTLGLTRISASGQTIWAKTFTIGEGGIVGLACSPLGNVFVGVDVTSGPLDLGGGQIFGGAVVKLTPAGAFTWQYVLRDSMLTSFAVDGNGSVLAAFTAFYQVDTWHATKLRWDGAVLWQISEHDEQPNYSAPAKVAWDPTGHAAVASRAAVRRYDANGKLIWTARFADPVNVQTVGTTSIGTVVVAGTYSGALAIGGARLDQGTGPGAFVAVLEGVDGYVRWAKNRVSDGPMAVDPVGRLAFIDRTARPKGGADCTADLARWDLTGKELWRRPLVTCQDAPNGWGAWGTGVAVGPNSQIWAQGYASAPFDPGTGTTYVPQSADWFIMRVAP